MVKHFLDKLKKFHGQYAPWISLGLGVLARGLSRKGVDFAPKAVAILALAWLLPLAVSRWLHAPAEGAHEPRLHHLLRTVSPTVTILLYKNVLFFLAAFEKVLLEHGFPVGSGAGVGAAIHTYTQAEAVAVPHKV